MAPPNPRTSEIAKIMCTFSSRERERQRGRETKRAACTERQIESRTDTDT
jgi:hypothetical protein